MRQVREKILTFNSKIRRHNFKFFNKFSLHFREISSKSPLEIFFVRGEVNTHISETSLPSLKTLTLNQIFKNSEKFLSLFFYSYFLFQFIEF